MADDTTRQSDVFNDIYGKQVIVRFDHPDSSADGGAVMIKACDERTGLTRAIAACIADDRQQGKVVHTLEDLVRQRVFALALGHEDCGDAARVGSDPMHKLLLERDPITGEGLASLPTLSRFENALGPKTLMRMSCALADTVIERHRHRLRRRRDQSKRNTIDLDPTDDPTHGAQQLTFFNAHYDTWCYLSLAASV